jgi:hypothetical protein
MQVAERVQDWNEDEAGRLDREIRQSMTRLGNQASTEDNVRVGKLINQRIEAAYQRGLRAALSGKFVQLEKTARSGR